MPRRFVKTTLYGFITLFLQFICSFAVPNSFRFSLLEVSVHRLKLRIVLRQNGLFFFLRIWILITLKHVPLIIIGTGLTVEHSLRLLPVLPLGSASLLLDLGLLVIHKPFSQLLHALLQNITCKF